jgi:menaquinone-9 beta-reductase
MTISDVIVIGAGPAGLTTCFWLQKLGIPHILLEQKEFPREKSCADVITSNVIRHIREINEAFIPEMLEINLLNPIHGTDLSCTNTNGIHLNFKWLDGIEHSPSCYSIKRADFDNFLFEKLCENSLTKIITNCHITSVNVSNDTCVLKTKTGEVFQTKLVIVATGSNSNPMVKNTTLGYENIHNAIGIRAYYKGIDIPKNYCKLILDKSMMPGGFYIAPLAGDLYNVNIVLRCDAQKKNNINLSQALEDFIKTDSKLVKAFENATRVSDFMGSKLILGTKKRSVCGDRYMIAGDTAGLIDLVSANGIPQAMLSGKLAALQANRCLEVNSFSKDFLQSYERTLFKSIRKDLSVGKFVNPFIGFSIVNRFALVILRFLTRNPSVNSSLTKIMYHKHPILLLINPFFYVSLVKETISDKK